METNVNIYQVSSLYWTLYVNHHSIIIHSNWTKLDVNSLGCFFHSFLFVVVGRGRVNPCIEDILITGRAIFFSFFTHDYDDDDGDDDFDHQDHETCTLILSPICSISIYYIITNIHLTLVPIMRWKNGDQS